VTILKILKSKKEEYWSLIDSLKIINNHSFILNLKNGDIRYFNILDALKYNNYHFNEYEKNRLKTLFEKGDFKLLDINCGVISWGGWIEILPDEIYEHTIEYKGRSD